MPAGLLCHEQQQANANLVETIVPFVAQGHNISLQRRLCAPLHKRSPTQGQCDAPSPPENGHKKRRPLAAFFIPRRPYGIGK